MTTNRLAKSEAAESRKGWTLQEHCEYANAQLILNGSNDYRHRMGLEPVHWVIRNGRVVCEWKHPPKVALA